MPKIRLHKENIPAIIVWIRIGKERKRKPVNKVSLEKTQNLLSSTMSFKPQNNFLSRNREKNKMEMNPI
jgi:hypothetical protein